MVHFWTNGSLSVWVDLDSEWISLMEGINHDDMLLSNGPSLGLHLLQQLNCRVQPTTFCLGIGL